MMSSFLCFVCHSTVNADTSEDTREKYREVIGMNLCPDSHLCHICCYFLNKMWLFKSICLKRSLEYPVLFSEKGTINLQRSETSVAIMCPEDICIQHLNTRYHFYNHNENSQSDFGDNNYCELQDDRHFEGFLKHGPFENLSNEDFLFVTKDNVEDNLFNEDLILPNLEPVRITQNDLVNGEWTHNQQTDINDNNQIDLNANNNFRIEPNTNDDFRIEPSNTDNNFSIEPQNTNDNFTINPPISNDNYQIVPNTNDNFQIGPNANDNYSIDPTPLQQNCRNEITIEGIIVPVPIDDNNVPISVDQNNIPILITIEENDVPIIECADTPSFEQVMMVNNISFNPKTNLYEQVESKIDEETANDINETIGINIDENIDTNIEEDIFNSIINDDLGPNINDSLTKIINEAIGNNNDDESSKDFKPPDIQPEDETKIKKKTFYFERIELTSEQQKKELEEARKNLKYIEASFKCHSCAIHFHFKDTYLAHMMRHEESNGEYSCRICSLRFANSSVLRKHSANHRIRYSCSECSTVVRERQRQTHVRLCTGVTSNVNCHLCGQSFTNMRLVRQHLQRYHKTQKSNKTHLCNVCGKNYITRAKLRTHMITHINKKFNCDQCSATFSSPYSLTQHTRWKHASTEPEVHNCSACKVSYKSRKSLLAHLRNSVAHKNTGHACGSCGRVCPTRAALTAHAAAVHARTRHLVCEICPHRRYSTQRSLARHLAKHKEGKPVPLCHACGARFQSANVLKKHLMNVCEKNRKLRELEEESAKRRELQEKQLQQQKQQAFAASIGVLRTTQT